MKDIKVSPEIVRVMSESIADIAISIGVTLMRETGMALLDGASKLEAKKKGSKTTITTTPLIQHACGAHTPASYPHAEYGNGY